MRLSYPDFSLHFSLTTPGCPHLLTTPVVLSKALEQGVNGLVVLPTESKQVTLAEHKNGDALLQQGRRLNHSSSTGRAIVARTFTA